MSSKNEGGCDVEPVADDVLRFKIAGSKLKHSCFRVALPGKSRFSGNAKVNRSDADVTFAFHVLDYLYVVILTLVSESLLTVDIDFGVDHNFEETGKAEFVDAIDTDTAKKIKSNKPNNSLLKEKSGRLFFEMKTVSDNRIKIPYDPELTIKDLKLLVLCFALHRDWEFNNAFHLFFMAAELTDDFQKLSQIPRFGPNSVIHITNTGGQGGRTFMTPYLENLNNMEILLRNANECNNFAKRNQNALERDRFSEPVFGTELNDSFPCFGDITERIGELMVSYSTQLNRLADVLDKDERLVQNTQKYEETKQIIQNNLDTARYAGPLMKNLTSVRVCLTNNRLNAS
ncbi:Oidioi.mRNA.OKI2018_I69.PAR.g11240.t1.cds [Oikopleura dioica]|uniref:Oidioi.mRNA.OKI2018_I69.PAR.g11240.t1.cds n=1 Tax=Oikopleura dioica TaxID=34765 RepID=A0ABN7RY09_OIKDI|nr:Oidioi.mRNA.OKI2018_I69.PAR.g11240.t1.cds [Oikopleura dioica]